ncbi:hypothetical protein [Algibacter sp. 2305UL17-15]|uniref:hypothetical protein n=1 Tax=Algibacter sp. 2305UL17-15 TaxID=3231268 RepID=UPI00345851C4
MNFRPIHTRVLEEKTVADLTIIRESSDNYLEGISNVYAKNSLGEIIWNAELPLEDDCYPNPIQWNKTLNAEFKNWSELIQDSPKSFVASSWKGITVCIDYRNGEILQSEFTK